MSEAAERERVTIDDLDLANSNGYLYVQERFVIKELDRKRKYIRKSETILYIITTSILKRPDTYYKRGGAKNHIKTFGIIYPSGHVQVIDYTRIIRSPRGFIIIR